MPERARIESSPMRIELSESEAQEITEATKALVTTAMAVAIGTPKHGGLVEEAEAYAELCLELTELANTIVRLTARSSNG